MKDANLPNANSRLRRQIETLFIIKGVLWRHEKNMDYVTQKNTNAGEL